MRQKPRRKVQDTEKPRRHAQDAEKSRRGARSHQITFESRTRAWRRHHGQMAVDSLHRLRQRPLATLMTMLAIAIAMVLPASLWLALGSAQLLDSNLDDSARMTLYLDPALSESQAMDITDRVRGESDIASTELITAAAGLESFQQRLGMSDALAMMDDNPLPATILVQPRSRDPDAAQALAERLGQLEGVSDARLDMAWLERLRQLSELGRRVVMAFGVLFALGVLLVVGNTIRLAVESRRQEIGDSDWCHPCLCAPALSVRGRLVWAWWRYSGAHAADAGSALAVGTHRHAGLGIWQPLYPAGHRAGRIGFVADL